MKVVLKNGVVIATHLDHQNVEGKYNDSKDNQVYYGRHMEDPFKGSFAEKIDSDKKP